MNLRSQNWPCMLTWIFFHRYLWRNFKKIKSYHWFASVNRKLLKSEVHLYPRLCPQSSFWGQDCSSTVLLPSTPCSHLSLTLMCLHTSSPNCFSQIFFFSLETLSQSSPTVVLLVTSLLNSRGYMPAHFSLPASLCLSVPMFETHLIKSNVCLRSSLSMPSCSHPLMTIATW